MKIEYEDMREIVLRYCNQDYPAGAEPNGLKRIIEQMRQYVESIENSTVKSTAVADCSVTYDERDVISKFSKMLSPYKRLKTL